MTIKVYSTPSCVYCKMLKDFLEEKHISFQEFNVMEDLKARDEMVQKSNQMGVPVVDIDGQVFVGFTKPEIAKALGIQ